LGASQQTGSRCERGGIKGITFELLLEEDLAGDGCDRGEREQCREGK
jgi:hypothetical protein